MSKPGPLSHNQIAVLVTAVLDSGYVETRTEIPHGVYRSLTIRGMIAPTGNSYKITEEGRERVVAEITRAVCLMNNGPGGVTPPRP